MSMFSLWSYILVEDPLTGLLLDIAHCFIRSKGCPLLASHLTAVDAALCEFRASSRFCFGGVFLIWISDRGAPSCIQFRITWEIRSGRYVHRSFLGEARFRLEQGTPVACEVCACTCD